MHKSNRRSSKTSSKIRRVLKYPRILFPVFIIGIILISFLLGAIDFSVAIILVICLIIIKYIIKYLKGRRIEIEIRDITPKKMVRLEDLYLEQTDNPYPNDVKYPSFKQSQIIDNKPDIGNEYTNKSNQTSSSPNKDKNTNLFTKIQPAPQSPKQEIPYRNLNVKSPDQKNNKIPERKDLKKQNKEKSQNNAEQPPSTPDDKIQITLQFNSASNIETTVLTSPIYASIRQVKAAIIQEYQIKTDIEISYLEKGKKIPINQEEIIYNIKDNFKTKQEDGTIRYILYIDVITSQTQPTARKASNTKPVSQPVAQIKPKRDMNLQRPERLYNRNAEPKRTEREENELREMVLGEREESEPSEIVQGEREEKESKESSIKDKTHKPKGTIYKHDDPEKLIIPEVEHKPKDPLPNRNKIVERYNEAKEAKKPPRIRFDGFRKRSPKKQDSDRTFGSVDRWFKPKPHAQVILPHDGRRNVPIYAMTDLHMNSAPLFGAVSLIDGIVVINGDIVSGNTFNYRLKTLNGKDSGPQPTEKGTWTDPVKAIEILSNRRSMYPLIVGLGNHETYDDSYKTSDIHNVDEWIFALRQIKAIPLCTFPNYSLRGAYPSYKFGRSYFFCYVTSDHKRDRQSHESNGVSTLAHEIQNSCDDKTDEIHLLLHAGFVEGSNVASSVVKRLAFFMSQKRLHFNVLKVHFVCYLGHKHGKKIEPDYQVDHQYFNGLISVDVLGTKKNIHLVFPNCANDCIRIGSSGSIQLKARFMENKIFYDFK